MTAEPKKTLAQIRAENTERLGGDLSALRNGSIPGALEPFARAYLGLFLDLSTELSPEKRVAQLADPQLAAAVLDGFVSVVRTVAPPTPSEVGLSRLHGDDPVLGHIILAGMDRLCDDGTLAGDRLPDAVLAVAVCLALDGQSEVEPRWLPQLMADRPQLVVEALWSYWRELIAAGLRYLPGMHVVFGKRPNHALVAPLALRLLDEWHSCDDRVLRELLFSAMAHSNRDRLLEIVERNLDQAGPRPVRRSMNWYATALLLAPQRYAETVTAVCGHNKERVLPLLDIASRAAAPHAEGGLDLQLSVTALARLLRIIGPVFPPQMDDEGPSDRISQKVLRLFELFGAHHGAEAQRAKEWLRSVRVMNRCAQVLDRL